MDLTNIKDNASTLLAEMQWLNAVIDKRFELYWGNDKDNGKDLSGILPPDL